MANDPYFNNVVFQTNFDESSISLNNEPDPYESYVILNLSGNGTNGLTTLTDDLNQTFSSVGNAKVDITELKFSSDSGNILLDGNGNAFSGPTGAWDFGTGDFTMEAWIMLKGDNQVRGNETNSHMMIFSTPHNTSGFDWGIWDSNTAASALGMENKFNNVYGNGGHGGFVFQKNIWYHVAMTRQGTTLRNFVNGNIVGSNQHSSTIQGATGGSALGIGYLNISGYYRYFNGRIAHARITKGVARYTTNFTPPTKAFPTKQRSNEVVSCHPNKSAYPSRGLSLSSQFKKSGSHSLACNGTNFLYTQDHADYTLQGVNFTGEAWVYLTSADYSQFRGIISHGSSGATISGYQLCLMATTGFLSLEVGNGTTALHIASQNALTLNKWTHIAFTKSLNTWSLYIDGILRARQDTTIYADSNVPLYIGTSRSASVGGFIGLIDSVRLTKGVARYPLLNSPTKDDYLQATSMSIITEGADNIPLIDQTGRVGPITRSGAAPKTTERINWYGYSLAFNAASSQSLSFPSSASFNFGTGDFTIEMSVYALAHPGPGFYNLYDQWVNASSGSFPIGQLVIYINPAGLVTAAIATTASVQSFIGGTTAWTLNSWNHIALVRSNGIINLYLNGISTGSLTYSGQAGLTNALMFGRQSTSAAAFFTGYLEMLRLTKAARYTSNFTPAKPSLEQAIQFRPENFPQGASTVQGRMVSQRLVRYWCMTAQRVSYSIQP